MGSEDLWDSASSSVSLMSSTTSTIVSSLASSTARVSSFAAAAISSGCALAYSTLLASYSWVSLMLTSIVYAIYDATAWCCSSLFYLFSLVLSAIMSGIYFCASLAVDGSKYVSSFNTMNGTSSLHHNVSSFSSSVFTGFSSVVGSVKSTVGSGADMVSIGWESAVAGISWVPSTLSVAATAAKHGLVSGVSSVGAGLWSVALFVCEAAWLAAAWCWSWVAWLLMSLWSCIVWFLYDGLYSGLVYLLSGAGYFSRGAAILARDTDKIPRTDDQFMTSASVPATSEHWKEFNNAVGVENLIEQLLGSDQLQIKLRSV